MRTLFACPLLFLDEISGGWPKAPKMREDRAPSESSQINVVFRPFYNPFQFTIN
jgi:hypothetical protein